MEKCTIIGSGPAGYTAAIYAARANLNPLLFTGMEPGGQLMMTTDVENFPGYPDGVLGAQMMEDFKNQALRFGTTIKNEIITKVEFSKNKHLLTTDANETIESSTVIIATGASAKWLGLESEQRLMNLGVSACAVCDGFFFRGQDVVVVGGGDSAVEEAVYLSKLCSKVHMLVRRDEFRASKYMQEKVFETENIEVHWNTELVEILGSKEVEGVKVIQNKTNEHSVVDVTGVFIAIGHSPNTGIFKGQLELDDIGYIITASKSTATNLPGVFACGDVQDPHFRQAVTAAGSGCMAALEAERYLVKLGVG